MTKSIVRKAIRIAVCGICVGLAGAAAARADDQVLAVAKIPFAFIVGNVQLPAGSYIVRESSEDANVLEISTVDGAHTAWMFTIPSEPSGLSDTPQLAFEDFDNHHFLSRVMPGNGIAREIVLTESTMKREIDQTSTRRADN